MKTLLLTGLAIVCAMAATSLAASERQGHDTLGIMDDFVRSGIRRANSGDLEQAVRLFNESLRRSKNNVDALYNRGKVLLIQGRLNKAKKDLEKVVKLRPEHSGAYVALAMVHKSRGDFAKALKDLNHAVSLDPNDAGILSVKAALLVDLGAYEKALKDFTTIVKLNPGQIRALGNRAYILEQLGRYDEAIKDLSAVIALKPKNGMAMKHLGYIYGQKGEPKMALRWYRMALELEGDEQCRGKLKRAIRELERKSKTR